MSTNKTRKKLKIRYVRAKNALGAPFSPITNVFSRWIERLKLGATKPQIFAYQIIGGQTSHFMPLFKDLDVNLKKSGMKINFKAYVSTVILASLLLSAFFIIIVPLLLFFVFKLSLFSSLLFGTGLGLLAGALTVTAFYAYPIYRADTLRTKCPSLQDTCRFWLVQACPRTIYGVPSPKLTPR